MLRHAVTLTFDPLTLMAIMYRLSREDQSLYQILEKSNNPGPSYSDLNITNFEDILD